MKLNLLAMGIFMLVLPFGVKAAEIEIHGAVGRLVRYYIRTTIQVRQADVADA